MKAVFKFRLLAIALIILIGVPSIGNLAAEFIRPSKDPLASTIKAPSNSGQLSAAKLSTSIAPLREDLKADYALLLTGKALNGERDLNNTAAAAFKDALRIGPHDTEAWLGLALLQLQATSVDPRAAEFLKMAYLTGPNQAELIPVRLMALTSNNALTDPDLRELARADVRVLLAQGSDGRSILLGMFKHATEAGKQFIDDSTRIIDPDFATRYRAQ